jgi:hypothetical protein
MPSFRTLELTEPLYRYVRVVTRTQRAQPESDDGRR